MRVLIIFIYLAYTAAAPTEVVTQPRNQTPEVDVTTPIISLSDNQKNITEFEKQLLEKIEAINKKADEITEKSKNMTEEELLVYRPQAKILDLVIELAEVQLEFLAAKIQEEDRQKTTTKPPVVSTNLEEKIVGNQKEGFRERPDSKKTSENKAEEKSTA